MLNTPICPLSLTQPYVQSKLRAFGYIVCQHMNPGVPRDYVEQVLNSSFQALQAQEAVQVVPPRNLRLVLRHDCQ
mgnify:CR=1 FL=1